MDGAIERAWTAVVGEAKWRGVYVEAARANKAGQMNPTRMRELLSLALSFSLSLCHSPDCRLMDDDKRQKVHVSSLTEPHKLYYIFYIKKNCLCKHFETFAKNVFFESCCRLSPSRSHLCLLFRLRPECIKLSLRLARVLTFALT